MCVDLKSGLKLVLSDNGARRNVEQVDECHERLAESLVRAGECNVAAILLHGEFSVLFLVVRDLFFVEMQKNW